MDENNNKNDLKLLTKLYKSYKKNLMILKRTNVPIL